MKSSVSNLSNLKHGNCPYARTRARDTYLFLAVRILPNTFFYDFKLDRLDSFDL